MKKANYTSIYVMIATASHKSKREKKHVGVDDTTRYTCTGNKAHCHGCKAKNKTVLADEEVFQLFA